MSNRHTVLRLSFGAVLAIVLLSMSMLTYAQETSSSSSSSAQASSSSVVISIPTSSAPNTTSQTITVEQVIDGQTDFAALGTWVISKPDFTEQSGSNSQSGVNSVIVGSYTLFADAPEGMTTTTYLFRNGVQESVTSRPQITFKVEKDQAIRVLFVYKLTQVGKVGVNSDPPGLTFTLSGPNKSVHTGVTPIDYDIAPNGQYSVTYGTPEGCPPLPSKSMKLEAKGRIVFNIELNCTTAEALKSQNTSKKSSSSAGAMRSSKSSPSTALTGSITTVASSSFSEIIQPKPTPSTEYSPGQLIDVPPNAWFAPIVFKVTQRGIIKGYNDEFGKPNGMFGPANLVTIAELSAIAHRLGNISEQPYANIPPTNSGALNFWFTPYFSSAEQRGWTVYQDPFVEIDRPASRAEVVQTFLQVLDVPLEWPKGGVFADVPPRSKYAAAIETAAHKGYVEGRGEAGTSQRLFVPHDPINRAELAKMINNILDLKEAGR